jgi:Spy/CpxP family protein refolding chaperone
MRKTWMTAAVAASLVAATAAWAHGGHGAGMAGADCPMASGTGMQGMGHRGGMGMGGMGSMRVPEAAAQRLATMKDALKLRPDQAAAWDAFEAKARSNVETRSKMREGMAERRGNADAMAEYRVTMMKFNAQAAEEMLAARKALAAVLTPEQKATFDTFGPGMGPMARGPAARGPGMGRGFGPGTPGAGPCCTPGGAPTDSVHSGA